MFAACFWCVLVAAFVKVSSHANCLHMHMHSSVLSTEVHAKQAPWGRIEAGTMCYSAYYTIQNHATAPEIHPQVYSQV